jgi:hypothetical protein
MLRTLAIALLAAATSPAAAATDFASLVTGAERLETLEPFLARYVGHCTDIYERRTCEANVAASRRAGMGKTFAGRVPDAAALVQPRLQGERFTLLVTPFVDGGGLALSNGAPLRQDPQGNPLVGLIPISGKIPSGTMELEFHGPFRTGAIELEIVYRPERTWKLPRREGGSYEGVAARFLAIRVLDARTGNEIASKVL